MSIRDTRRVRVDLDSVKKLDDIYFRQFDTNEIHFTIFKDRKVIPSPEIDSVSVNFERADGKVHTTTLSSVGDRFVYELGNLEMSVEGSCKLTLQVFKDGARRSSNKLKVFLTSNIESGLIPPEHDVISVYEKLLELEGILSELSNLGDLEVINSDISSLKNKVLQLEGINYDEDFSTIDDEFRALKRRVLSLENEEEVDLSVIEGKIQSLESDLIDLSDSVNNTVNSSLAPLDARVVVLESKPDVNLTPINNEITNVKSKITILENEMSAIPSPIDVTPINNEITSIKNKLVSLESEIDDIPNPVDVTPLQNEINILKGKVAALESNNNGGGSGGDLSSIEDDINFIRRSKDSFVYVKDFGAKGDGVTDDRAAIQAAFDYAVNNGCYTVIFERGDYRILSEGGLYQLPKDNGTASPNFKSLGDTDIAAEKTNYIKYGLSMHEDLRLIGQGGVTIRGNFPKGTAINITTGNTSDGGDTINSLAGMIIHDGDVYTGTLYTHVYVEGISFNNFFIAMISNGVLGGTTAGKCFENVWIGDCAIAGLMRGVDNAIFDKVSIYDCYAGFIVGGWWTHRNRTGYNNNNLPPYPSNDVAMVGWVDFLTMTNIRHFNLSLNYDNYARSIDAFFDKYFFKSNNSKLVNNGGRFTLNSDNTFDENFIHDYPGIVGRTFSCFNRYGRLLQNVTASNIKTWGIFRDVISVFGRNNFCTASNFYTERSGFSNVSQWQYMSENDPYANAGDMYFSARGLEDYGNLYHFDSANEIGCDLYKERTILFNPTMTYRQTNDGPEIEIAHGAGKATYKDGIVHFELYLTIDEYAPIGYYEYFSRLLINKLPFTPRRYSNEFYYTSPVFAMAQGFTEYYCVGIPDDYGYIELRDVADYGYITEYDVRTINGRTMLSCSGSYEANRSYE